MLMELESLRGRRIGLEEARHILGELFIAMDHHTKNRLLRELHRNIERYLSEMNASNFTNSQCGSGSIPVLQDRLMQERMSMEKYNFYINADGQIDREIITKVDYTIIEELEQLLEADDFLTEKDMKI